MLDLLTYISNKQRRHEIKTVLYDSKIKEYKNTVNTFELEKTLNETNSKDCRINEFKKYLIQKFKTFPELFLSYTKTIFRKFKWYKILNTHKSEDKLIKKLIELYGDKAIIILGDWSTSKQMKNFCPTPLVRIRKLLATHFKIYMIDEFRTSLLNYKTHEKTENLYLPIKKDGEEKMKKIHSVLTYKMDNGRLGCINRDKNAIHNMKYITEYYLEHRRRPDRYTRGYILEDPIDVT